MINIAYQDTGVLEPVQPLTTIEFETGKKLDKPLRFLVLQHERHEGPGIYGEMAEEKGIDLETINVRRSGYRIPRGNDLKHFDAALILGGSCGVNDNLSSYPSRDAEMDLIRNFHGPTLGHCLGSQLIFAAHGGTVAKGHLRECGFYRQALTEAGTKSRIFRGLPRELMVFQWHGDYLQSPPAGAITLAGSENYDIQAFQIGNKIGILGHPEAMRADIERLFEFDTEWFSAGNHGNTREQVMEAGRKYGPDMNRHARTTFGNFISMAREH